MFFFSLTSTVFSQENVINGNICASVIRPQSIPHNGVVKALIIYVKFKDDFFDLPPLTDDWPSNYGNGNERPPWTENILSPNINTEPVHPSLSGYFKSLSMGDFQIIGDEYPQYPEVYRTRMNIEDYKHYNCGGPRALSHAVYEAITNLDDQIEFENYDNDGSDGIPNSGDDDGYVDMLLMWFRFHVSHTTDCRPYNGIANLTGYWHNYFIPGVTEINTDDNAFNGGKIKIKSNSGEIGEGAGRNAISIHIHELAHTMGFFQHWHAGVWNILGAVNGVGVMNTYERNIQSGWMPLSNITTIDLPGIHNINLTDYETTGKAVILKTINNGKYVIENRSGNSFYSKAGSWVMPGNGILITHYSNENNPDNFQIEAADHKWDHIKTPGGNCSNCNNSFTYNVINNIFQHNGPSNNGELPLDMIGVCTNNGCKNNPLSIGAGGNVYAMDYNEVFSSWSNPMSVKGPQGNDITIELANHSSDSSYNLYIHYDLPNGYQNTSPSKPLWLQTSKEYIQTGRWHPKITWIANTEPDIQNYKVLRGLVTDPDTDPNYTLIASSVTGSSYIDNEIYLYDRGGGSGACTYVERTYSYRIVAVDTEAKESVRSDRALITGYHAPCDPEDGPPIEELNYNIPSEYSVFNYPNPFNPKTNIRFSLPVSGNVKIKIHNLLGEEILSITDYLEAGNYSIPFDGKNLPSGVYIYSMECGSFYQAKKMLLIK